jgi:serine/threonine protein kinase
MEYCKGGSLIDFAKKIKKINEEILASIMKQLLSALAYLHKQGIVHRDIKLENIVFLEIVHKNNVKDYLHIKIIDFGTAIKLKKDKKIVGTRFYMAPEVFRGVINEKSDIWSCGIFLYTIISGNFPFRGGNNDELRTNIESKPLIYTCIRKII